MAGFCKDYLKIMAVEVCVLQVLKNIIIFVLRND